MLCVSTGRLAVVLAIAVSRAFILIGFVSGADKSFICQCLDWLTVKWCQSNDGLPRSHMWSANWWSSTHFCRMHLTNWESASKMTQTSHPVMAHWSSLTPTCLWTCVPPSNLLSRSYLQGNSVGHWHALSFLWMTWHRSPMVQLHLHCPDAIATSCHILVLARNA